MNVTFTEEEVKALIGAIHLAQDMYADMGDSMAKSLNEEDQEFGRVVDKRQDLLDSARRKLGDTWEPDPSYRAPDSPEGLV